MKFLSFLICLILCGSLALAEVPPTPSLAGIPGYEEEPEPEVEPEPNNGGGGGGNYYPPQNQTNETNQTEEPVIETTEQTVETPQQTVEVPSEPNKPEPEAIQEPSVESPGAVEKGFSWLFIAVGFIIVAFSVSGFFVYKKIQHNKELAPGVAYVEKCLTEGKSREEIALAMESGGWHTKDVDDVFAKVK